MNKIILKTFIFFIFCTSVFAAKISDIDFNSKNFKIKLSRASTNDYIVSVDEDTHLVYIEISNLDKKSLKIMSKKIEKKMRNSNFFKDVSIDKFDGTLALTLQINSKISYSVNKSNREIKIDFRGKNKNKYLIVLDPGHGGKDPGASRGRVVEKNIILAVSKLLRNNLKKDFDIVMTRDKDYFVNLHERPKIANRKKAKLFVSIHANAALNKKANGVEVFYFSKKSSPYAERIANFENSFGEKYGESSSDIAQISGELAYKKNQENSIKLANKIVQKVSTNMALRNGKTHGANFAVLRGFNGTGVLVELGFITNRHDAKILMSRKGQEQLAKNIANSIKEYLE